MSQRRQTLRQMATFGVVGVAGTATHYVTALATAQFVHPLIANLFGYCLAVGVSYGGHHRFTFRVHRAEARHRRRFPRFVIVSLSAVSLSEVVLWLTLEQTDWPLWLAQLAAIAVVPPVTYLLGRYWVFADEPGWGPRIRRWFRKAG